MVRWARIVQALDTEFAQALRLAQDILGLLPDGAGEVAPIFSELLVDLEQEGGCWKEEELVDHFPEGGVARGILD